MAPAPASTAAPGPAPAAVLVPVKAFAAAKARLAAALGPADRAALARSMAEAVLTAARPLAVTVACDDGEVAAWAAHRGASVVLTPGLDLNGAVQRGVAALAAAGVARVVVAHADLPWATDLPGLLAFDGVTLVPDRGDDGTNVICLPAGAGFTFAYGPRSFGRHVAQVRRLGLALRVARIPRLQHDVDSPDDLTVPLPA